ncbi:hypothetical protein ACFONI_11090 [Aeromonas media]|uniref:hypothetical protein n=1 Tax=Aeromonas media TaxID=651 RepID=UPI00360EA437
MRWFLMSGDGLGRMSRRRARGGHGARVGSTLLSGGQGGKFGLSSLGAPRVGGGAGSTPSTQALGSTWRLAAKA